MENKPKQQCEFYVEGMHCASCELLIENKLSKVSGVIKVDAKLNEGKVYITSTDALDPKLLSTLVEKDGYKITLENNKIKTLKVRELLLSFLIALVFFFGFLLLQGTGIINLGSGSEEITLPFVFLIGVVASLSTCMAVVGGLVLSLSSNYAKEKSIKPIFVFHISRIIGFFLLGGVIGLLGSAFILTPLMTFVLNFLLFIIMLILGVNLLEIFSLNTKLQIRMPKSIGKRAFKLSETNNFFTPLLLGVATFFLPCGFTQSMQFYSLTTGSFFNGAITMLVFALGTLPILALISFATTKLFKVFQSGLVFKTTGFIVIMFAIFNLLTALSAVGIIDPIFAI